MRASVMLGLGRGLEVIIFTDNDGLPQDHIGIRHIQGSHLSILDLGLCTKDNIEGIQHTLERLKEHAT